MNRFLAATALALALCAPIAAHASDAAVCYNGRVQLIKAYGWAFDNVKGNNSYDTGALRVEMNERMQEASGELGNIATDHIAAEMRGRTPEITCKEAVERAMSYMLGDLPTPSAQQIEEAERASAAAERARKQREDKERAEQEAKSAQEHDKMCNSTSFKAPWMAGFVGCPMSGKTPSDGGKSGLGSNGGDPSLQHAPRGWIGVNVQSVTIDIANSMGLTSTNGALVATIQKDSPAAQVGIQSGDVITVINGETVVDEHDLANKTATLGPKKTATLAIIRNGAPMTLDVTLGTNPDDRR